MNGIETISRAIKSAQLQTVQDIEIIVIDDASTDGTFEFVSALSTQDKRIKIIRLLDNIGSGAARNEGMKLAEGKWIAVLDADDWIEPIRFEILSLTLFKKTQLHPLLNDTALQNLAATPSNQLNLFSWLLDRCDLASVFISKRLSNMSYHFDKL